MREFAALYQALDDSTATADKVAAMARHFAAAAPADAAWAVYFLAGGRPRQIVPTAVLRELACERAGLPDWLFEECYQAVGDLAETISLVLPDGVSVTADGGLAPQAEAGLAAWVEQRLLPLAGLAPAEKKARLAQAFDALDQAGRYLLVKLIGGGFRVGVSKLLVQRALAQVSGLDAKLIAQRMVGWGDARHPVSAASYLALLRAEDAGRADPGQPYPFFLAHALEGDPAALGPRSEWLAEWKYDGIRAQLVKRAAGLWIWSRGEELVTERFPEIVAAAGGLPDGCVIDGEILAWLPGTDRPAPFQRLQQRIGRKTLTKKVLAESPVRMLAYDLLEQGGADLRNRPQHERRAALLALLDGQAIEAAPLVDATDWAGLARERESAREGGFEGLMLKQRDARYGSGRTKADGVWWKWKVDPLSVDGVLIYAQAGHGRRASVYTDYTFAVWSRTPRDAAEAQAVVDAIARREPAQPGALQLVAFAKAYSGLSDAEFQAVDREIRAHTLEKFGPVRSVRPTLVFELAFEGIQASPRHKSGIALRFPRMRRIRHDKPLHEADTLQTLLALVAAMPH